MTRFQFIKAFRLLFDNPDWGKNLLFATLCMFIPLVGPIVLLGWQTRVLRAVVRKDKRAVPAFDFNEFVEYLKEGLIPFIVSFLIMLPIAFLVGIIGIIAAIVVPALAQSGQTMSSELGAPLILIGVVVGAVFMFVFGVIMNAMMTRAMLTEDLGEALKFGDAMTYAKMTWKSVLVVMLVFVPLSIVIMLLGMIALYVGSLGVSMGCL